MKKINKKAFTLVELLGVIIILSLLLLLIIPSVVDLVKGSVNDVDDTTKEIIYSASKLYVSDNTEFRENDGSSYCIPLQSLIDEGYIKEPVKDYGLDKDITSSKSVQVTYDNGYNYELKDSSKCVESNNPGGNGGDQGDQPITEPKSFATDDWPTIIANVQAGNGEAYKEHIGEEKDVTFGGEFENQTYKVRLANVESPEDCNNGTFSETACGFVIEFVDIISTHVMNNSASNSGGWEKSEMRTYLNDGDASVLKALPQELQDGIINTRVVSGHGSEDQNNFTTTDKLYLLSTREVYGTESSYDSATNETRQLDYYKQKGVTGSSYSGAIKNYNGASSVGDNYWWLRAASSDKPYLFFMVHNDGALMDAGSNSALGVAPAFRLG